MPAIISLDISDITTPDFVGGINTKFPIKMVGNIKSLSLRELVRMGAWLLADKRRFAHQSAHFERPDLDAQLFSHHLNQCSPACRITAHAEQLFDFAT